MNSHTIADGSRSALAAGRLADSGHHLLRQLLAFLLLALLSTIGFAAEPSLISNGSFESDGNEDQWPDGWARAKSGVTWQAEEGKHFLRLTSEKPRETVMLFHAVKLPEGCRALTLSWRMRCSDLKPGKQPWFNARILLNFKDAEGNKLSGGRSAPHT